MFLFLCLYQFNLETSFTLLTLKPLSKALSELEQFKITGHRLFSFHSMI